MKEESIGNANNKIVGENAPIQITDVLLAKRQALLEELQNIDLAISKLKEEVSQKIEELEKNKKLPEEGLQHIDALLKLEGIALNNLRNNSVTHGALALNDGSSITNAVFNILEKMHRPMHYKELTKKIQKKGIRIPGKNPSATLLSRINRDERFKRTEKRGTYALATWRVRTGKVKRRKRNKVKIDGKLP